MRIQVRNVRLDRESIIRTGGVGLREMLVPVFIKHNMVNLPEDKGCMISAHILTEGLFLFRAQVSFYPNIWFDEWYCYLRKGAGWVAQGPPPWNDDLVFVIRQELPKSMVSMGLVARELQYTDPSSSYRVLEVVECLSG